MHNWLIRIIILALTLVHFVGCAERHRDADAGRTAQEVEALFDEIRNGPAAQGGGLSAAGIMRDDPTTNIYFAESYIDPAGSQPPMGPVEAVTPIDFAELNLGIGITQIKSIRVWFFDQVTPDGRHNHALVMHILGGSQPLIFAVANDLASGMEESNVDGEGLFQVVFSTGNGPQLILKSDDTADGELNDVIQFKLHIDNGVDEPYFIGKISTMVGYMFKD